MEEVEEIVIDDIIVKNKDRKKVVSYSQYSMFESCRKKFKLKYIDKLGKNDSNIHSVFGTSVHETIQHFLSVMYGESKKAALGINLEALLYENMIKTFLAEQTKMNGRLPCTKEELIEFYDDGCNIMHYFTSKLKTFYPKQGFELVDIEYRLEVEVKPGVWFWGFIDVVLRDLISGKIIVVDIKTSTKGWSSYQKNDKTKTAQVLMYKKLYSERYDLDLNDISVEYHIMKRKIDPNSQWPIPRITKFVPSNGKPSVNRAWSDFMGFVDYVYDDGGNVRAGGDYTANPTKLCSWCEFKDNGMCNSWR